MKAPRKVNHHTAEWTFVGAAIVLGTMACSRSLPDISNLPRLAILAVALAVTTLCSVKQRLCLPRTLSAGAFALLVLLAAASTLWAANRGEALYDTARWVTAGALFLTVYRLYLRHPARTVVLLSRVAAIVIIVSVAVAVRQVLQLDGDLRWDNRYSITSLYTHKGSFALLMLFTAMPIVMRLRLPAVLTAGYRRHAPKGATGTHLPVQLFYWVLLALVAATLLFLAARTALLATAVLAVVLLIANLCSSRAYTGVRSRAYTGVRPYGSARYIFAFCVICVTFWGGTRLFASLPIGETPGKAGGVLSSATIVERHALWNTTLRLVDRHPVTGVGAGNWKVCYPEASTRDIFSVDVLDFTFVRPHNDYLRVLAELGYGGLLLLLLALAGPVARALGRTDRRSISGRMTGTALAWYAAMLVAAWIDFPFDRTELLLWCTIIAAILSASTNGRGVPPCTPAIGRGVLSCTPVVVVLLMMATAALAFHRMESERKYPDMMAANHAQRWGAMERTAREARTPLCSLTPVGTPIAYYEALAQEKQGKEAIATFAAALHDSPWHKQSLNDMGRLVYVTTHDADSAEVLFKKAIEVSPSFSYAWFNLAQLYLQEGKPEVAREVLMAYDPEAKRQRIDRLVWHYLSGDQALYYQHRLPAAEQQMRETLLKNCPAPTEHQRR